MAQSSSYLALQSPERRRLAALHKTLHQTMASLAVTDSPAQPFVTKATVPSPTLQPVAFYDSASLPIRTFQETTNSRIVKERPHQQPFNPNGLVPPKRELEHSRDVVVPFIASAMTLFWSFRSCRLRSLLHTVIPKVQLFRTVYTKLRQTPTRCNISATTYACQVQGSENVSYIKKKRM